MSVPFSNTHLRVPRGFGTVLEGLAREVLRDQPEDIPAFAAQYFEQLLKQREESGTDPAEWTARLEDRFYNNHAFNTTETVSHEKEAAEEETGSKEKTYESQTEDELSQSEEEPTLSNEQPPISDQTELAEGTDQENNDPTEQSTILLESRNTEKRSEKQPDEQSSTEKAKDFTKDRHDQFNRLGNEVNISPVPDSATQEFVLDMSNLLPSKETSNVDLGSQDEVSSKCEREDQQDDTFIDCENASVEKEEHTEVTEPLESLQYFALVNADVCASELGGTKPFEDGVFQEHTYSAEEGETFNSQLEENAVELPPSQYETPQDKQQEPEDQAQKQHERETTATEACNEETNKTLSHSQNSLDNNVIPKKDSLDEISYNDIPEDQCITEVSEEKTAKDDSTEVLLTYISDKNQNDEFKELGKSLTDNVSIEDTHETEMEIIKTDVPLEKEELQSHHTAFDILKDKGETNELNCSDDCERETDGKNTKIENENKDQETDYKQEHKEEISDDKPDLSSESKVKVQANEQDSKEDETTDEVCTQQEINNSKAIQNPSQLITSDISMTGVLRDNETSEENHEHQSGQNPQSYRIIGNSQSEDLKEEKQNMFKEHEEIGISEVQEEGEELGKEETITPTGSADWTAADHREEERPAVLEENNIASANRREKVILVL